MVQHAAMSRGDAPSIEAGRFGSRRRKRKRPPHYYDSAWQMFSKRYLAGRPHCEWCGSDEDLTVDHIIPLRRGGAKFDPDNLQPLCRFCNREKRDDDNRGYSLRVGADGVPLDPRHPARQRR